MTFWSVRGLAAWGADWAIRSIPEDCTTESHYKVAGGLELKPPFFRDIPPPRLHHPSHRTANPPMPPTLPPPTWSPDQQRCCRPLRPTWRPSQQRRDERQCLPTLAPTNKICPLPSDLEPRSKKGCRWRKRLPDLWPRTIPQFFKLPMKRPLHRPVATDQGVPIHLSIAQGRSKKGGMFHSFFDQNLRYEAPLLRPKSPL